MVKNNFLAINQEEMILNLIWIIKNIPTSCIGTLTKNNNLQKQKNRFYKPSSSKHSLQILSTSR